MERNPELAAYLGRWYEPFNTGDTSTVRDYISSAPDILGIGTDPREWWAGSDAVLSAWHTQLPEMHSAGMQFLPGDIRAFSEGSVGWFADQPTITLPDGSPVTARLTGVCHQEDGAWKMVQFHLSFGAMNEEAIGEQLTI